MIDPTRPTTAWLFQPCTLASPQQMVRIELATVPWSMSPPVEVRADFCVRAPGALLTDFFGLGEAGGLGSVSQLVRITSSTGAQSLVGTPPAGFRRSEASPYVHSLGSSKLYTLNDAQTLLAAYKVSTGAVTVTPFTVPTPCAPAGITTFAGILP